jgi:hypothetical protein
MNIQDLTTLLDKYGTPMLIIIVSGWTIANIFTKALWPFFLRWYDDYRKDRAEEKMEATAERDRLLALHEKQRQDMIAERDLFLGSLGAFNSTLVSRDAMLRDTLGTLASGIKTLSSEVKSQRKTKQAKQER